jgi:hypothetical protein
MALRNRALPSGFTRTFTHIAIITGLLEASGAA